MKKINSNLYVAPSGLDRKIAGLFTKNPIKKGDYILDYKGKIDKNLEWHRCPMQFFFQFKINEYCQRQYGFDIDEQTQIDSVDVGNLTRFINNAHDSELGKNTAMESCSQQTANANLQTQQMANVFIRVTFNGTESAAQFFARRDISENEELFFDYDIK